MKTLNEKLNHVQVKLNAPKNMTNAFGKYKYRNLEGILEGLKPLLKETGLTVSLSDEMVSVAHRIYVKATASVTDGTDTLSVNAYAREDEQKKGMDLAQLTGACSSYARKYAMNGLFAIDDTVDADGMDNTNSGSEKPKFNPPSKASADEKAQAWESFVEICVKMDVDAKEFLSADIDMNDKALVYGTVRKWLNSEDLLKQQLITYKNR